MRGWSVVILAMSAVAAEPAPAQRALPVSASQPFVHPHRKLAIPATLNGLPRDRATGAVADDLDDAFNFARPDQSEIVTVYIFRHVAGSVPVWFEQVRRAVLQRGQVYGRVTAIDAPAAIAPPHQTSASGLMQVFTADAGFRSTGAAILPIGPDWFVAIRYSSKTSSPEELRAHLTAAIAALGWPEGAAEQLAAVPVVPCATPLAFEGQAKPVAATSSGNLMSLLAISMTGDPKSKTRAVTTAPAPFCHDDGAIVHGYPGMGVYRPGGATDRYMVAINDAGRAFAVGPDTLAATVDQEISAKAAKNGGPTAPPPAMHWSATLVDLNASTLYAPVDRLPSPDQVVAIVSGPAVGRVTTWGDKRNISISTGALASPKP